MTNERRQEAIVIALIASAIVHVALMFYFRPKVMAVVINDDGKVGRREAMRVSRSEAKPNPVQIYDLDDVEAKREAPTAESSIDSITISPVENVSDVVAEIKNPAPEILSESEAEPIVEDPTVFEANVIKLDDVVSGKIAAMPIDTPTIVEQGATIQSAPDSGAIKPEIPDFNPDTFFPPEVAFEEKVTDRFESAPETKSISEFVPSEKVYEEVDEKVVEAEKEAIRELMNVDDANDLWPMLNVSMTKQLFEGYIYYKVMISPKTSASPTNSAKNVLPVVPKDIVILIDASGSIGNDRLESCRIAGKKILRTCTNTDDRFNIVAFRDKYKYLSQKWVNCDKEGLDYADAWLNRLAAHGRTDVFATISSVLTLPRDPRRPLIAMVVTDGEANTGVSETAQILSQFTSLNDGMISVYMYGVKSSANKELIDVLTRGNRGESYIHQGTRWTAGKFIDSLSAKFRDPVLTDLRIVYSANVNAEAFPRRLKNLYRGETLTFVGRVKAGTSEIAFSLKGLNGDKTYESFIKIPVAVASVDPSIPNLWKEEQAVDSKLN